MLWSIVLLSCTAKALYLFAAIFFLYLMFMLIFLPVFHFNGWSATKNSKWSQWSLIRKMLVMFVLLISAVCSADLISHTVLAYTSDNELILNYSCKILSKLFFRASTELIFQTFRRSYQTMIRCSLRAFRIFLDHFTIFNSNPVWKISSVYSQK